MKNNTNDLIFYLKTSLRIEHFKARAFFLGNDWTNPETIRPVSLKFSVTVNLEFLFAHIFTILQN